MVPLIQDEANSYWFFARTWEILPLGGRMDAGNHSLNSMMGAIASDMFGPTPLALRSGNLLSFVLYAWSAWRLAKSIGSSMVRWSFLVAITTCPFLIEYFALFRGYGMAMAFLLTATVELVEYERSAQLRNLLWAYGSMLLAIFANLSMVPLGALFAIWPLLSLGVKGQLKSIRMVGGVTGASMVFGLVVGYSAYVGMQLQKSGALYIGSDSGMITVTLHSLCLALFKCSNVVIQDVVLGLVGFASCVGVWWAGRYRSLSTCFLIFLYLFWGEVLLRVILQALFGVNYPEERAAFQYVLLFVGSVVLAIDQLAKRNKTWVTLALVFLAFPILTIAKVNLSSAMNDLQQGVPGYFVELVAQYQKILERPVIVGAGGAVPAPWQYEAFRRESGLQSVEFEQFDRPDHDIRIVPDYLLERAHSGYHVLDSSNNGHLYLLLRNEPLDLHLGLDSSVSDIIEPGMYSGLISLGGRYPGTTIFARISGRMELPNGTEDIRIIGEAKSDSDRLWYDECSLTRIRASWRGEDFDVIRRLPWMEGTSERYLYLYIPDPVKARLTNLRVRLYFSIDP